MRLAYQRTEYLPLHKATLFTCSSCGNARAGTYTSQRLGDRIKQHVPKHLIDRVTEPQRKRRSRPPKKSDKPGEGYQSAIACHLAANKACSERYSETDFKVLTRGRDKLHLSVLEAIYIYALEPVLCKQKLSVTNLTLFQHAHAGDK